MGFWGWNLGQSDLSFRREILQTHYSCHLLLRILFPFLFSCDSSILSSELPHVHFHKVTRHIPTTRKVPSPAVIPMNLLLVTKASSDDVSVELAQTTTCCVDRNSKHITEWTRCCVHPSISVSPLSTSPYGTIKVAPMVCENGFHSILEGTKLI